ncbi:MAG: MATE family efflux transporter, partial [Pseudomonadota bacterium]
MRKDHDGTGVPGAEPSSARPAPDGSAKFLTGDLMRHVAVMSLSASVGLVSVFLVDFVDLYFIALIGDPALTAAVGFAGALVFFNISATIGLMIAVGALAARRIGAGDTLGARRAATNVLALGVAIGAVLGVTLAVAATPLLAAMGAQGEALAAGTQYLQIVAPSLPIMVVGMAASGLLRAHGDARRAMTVTLTAGAVNAVLDPLFIFVLDLGLNGAALASVCARIAMALSALAPVYRHYGGLAPWNAAAFRADLPAILGIAGPAVLTNLATPAGAILVTRFMAAYGDDAVAGFAVISRLTPLVFCVIFALSGAVGPIV